MQAKRVEVFVQVGSPLVPSIVVALAGAASSVETIIADVTRYPSSAHCSSLTFEATVVGKCHHFVVRANKIPAFEITRRLGSPAESAIWQVNMSGFFIQMHQSLEQPLVRLSQQIIEYSLRNQTTPSNMFSFGSFCGSASAEIARAFRTYELSRQPNLSVRLRRPDPVRRRQL